MSNDATWEFELDSFDPDKLEGGNAPALGNFHVEVTLVDNNSVSPKSSSPQMAVDYEILRGDVPNQEGLIQHDYYAKTKAAVPRAVLFALATGLVTKEELTAAKQAGKPPRINYALAVGCQLCIKIEADEYQGKTRGKVEFGIWHLDSPEAKDIPKNAGKIAQLGDAAPDPFVAAAADEDVF